MNIKSIYHVVLTQIIAITMISIVTAEIGGEFGKTSATLVGKSYDVSLKLLRAEGSVILNSAIDGRIAEINVKPGQVVKKGDTIITLKHEVIRLQTERIDLKIKSFTGVKRAKVMLDFAQDEYEIIDKLANPDEGEPVVSPKEIKEALQKLRVAEIGVVDAQTELDLLINELALSEQSYQQHFLKAPYDGVVVQLRNILALDEQTLKEVEVGETIRAGQNVIAVINAKTMKIVDHVNPATVGKVKIGQKVKVFVAGHDNKAIEGTVNFISSVINLGQVKVEISVDNIKNPDIKSGQYPYLYRDGIKARVEW